MTPADEIFDAKETASVNELSLKQKEAYETRYLGLKRQAQGNPNVTPLEFVQQLRAIINNQKIKPEFDELRSYYLTPSVSDPDIDNVVLDVKKNFIKMLIQKDIITENDNMQKFNEEQDNARQKQNTEQKGSVIKSTDARASGSQRSKSSRRMSVSNLASSLTTLFNANKITRWVICYFNAEQFILNYVSESYTIAYDELFNVNKIDRSLRIYTSCEEAEKTMSSRQGDLMKNLFLSSTPPIRFEIRFATSVAHETIKDGTPLDKLNPKEIQIMQCKIGFNNFDRSIWTIQLLKQEFNNKNHHKFNDKPLSPGYLDQLYKLINEEIIFQANTPISAPRSPETTPVHSPKDRQEEFNNNSQNTASGSNLKTAGKAESSKSKKDASKKDKLEQLPDKNSDHNSESSSEKNSERCRLM